VLDDLKIRDCYEGFLYLVESVRNPPTLHMHHHRELELNLVVRGSISYVVEGRRYEFPARTLLWLFPNQEHQLVSQSMDAQCYVAVFKPKLIASACSSVRYEKMLKTMPQGEGQVLQSSLDPLVFNFLRHQMDEMVEEGLDPDVLNREAGYGPNTAFQFEHDDPDWLNAGLRHLLLYAWRMTARGGSSITPPERLHPAVQKALELLSDSGNEESLADLARACGASPSYLSRLFRGQMGMTLTKYRNSIQLAKFVEVYGSGRNVNMTEAVFAAGFGSYSQFYRVFVETYGRNPRDML